MLNIENHKRRILPSIEQSLSSFSGTNISFIENDIHIDIEELPYSFSFSFFQRFGWQVFLVPKKSIIEEDFSHELYEILQAVANTYNENIKITEKPEQVLFSA